MDQQFNLLSIHLQKCYFPNFCILTGKYIYYNNVIWKSKVKTAGENKYFQSHFHWHKNVKFFNLKM